MTLATASRDDVGIVDQKTVKWTRRRGDRQRIRYELAHGESGAGGESSAPQHEGDEQIGRAPLSEPVRRLLDRMDRKQMLTILSNIEVDECNMFGLARLQQLPLNEMCIDFEDYLVHYGHETLGTDSKEGAGATQKMGLRRKKGGGEAEQPEVVCRRQLEDLTRNEQGSAGTSGPWQQKHAKSHKLCQRLLVDRRRLLQQEDKRALLRQGIWSFLGYAVALGRDSIVNSLLQAGAVPFLFRDSLFWCDVEGTDGWSYNEGEHALLSEGSEKSLDGLKAALFLLPGARSDPTLVLRAEAAARFLRSHFHPAFAIYVLRCLLERAVLARPPTVSALQLSSGESPTEQFASCCICRSETDERAPEECVSPSSPQKQEARRLSSGVSSATCTPTFLFRCDTPDCYVCEPCLWRHLASPEHAALLRDEPDGVCFFSCPACQASLDVFQMCRASAAGGAGAAGAARPDQGERGTAAGATAATGTYSSLPDVVDLATFRRHPDYKTLKRISNNCTFASALSLRECKRLNVGCSKQQRSEALLKAVEAEDLLRLDALCAVGVDLQARNAEYGQTALFLACWQGWARGIEFFLGKLKPPRGCSLFNADAHTANCGLSSVFGVLRMASDGRLRNTSCMNLLMQMRPTGESSSDEVAEDHALARSAARDKYESIVVQIQHEAGQYESWKHGCDRGVPELTRLPVTHSYLVDNAFSDFFLEALLWLFSSVTPAERTSEEKERGTCAERRYFCDSESWIAAMLVKATALALRDDLDPQVDTVHYFPQMRFLCYDSVGGAVAPHTDLSRTRKGTTSTHTFILYLSDLGVRIPSSTAGTATDEGLGVGMRSDVTEASVGKLSTDEKCGSSPMDPRTSLAGGGETVLLEALPNPSTNPNPKRQATVVPTRGRLFLFPHECPHEGLPVLNPKKVLLRGEVRLRLK